MALKTLFLQTVEREFRNYVKTMYTLLREEVHVDSGALYDSILIEWKSRGHAVVGVDVDKLKSDNRNIGRLDYSLPYYYGSKPRFINAKPGNTLHWEKNGINYFAKSVRHPGYKGDKFVERAVAKRPKFK